MKSSVERNGAASREREEAFRAFFAAERDGLLRMCWGVTLDRELARDVTQEAMTRAWRSWDELSTADSRPAAWCRTVALNLVRSHWRRARTEREAVVLPAGAADLEVVDVDLVRALHRLSDRQREAIVLHHLVDLSVHEVAAAMGISESSVKEHLQRGRAQLERRLAPHVTPNQEART